MFAPELVEGFARRAKTAVLHILKAQASARAAVSSSRW
jgi:hypothetical protein